MGQRLLALLISIISLNAFSSGNNYSVGARSAGLAHASVSLSDVWSAHHNQAGLADVNNISAAMFYENRFMMPELGLKGGVFVLPVGNGAFAMNIASFGYAKYSESKYGLAYGRKLGERISAGIQMNYFRVNIAENYGNLGVFTAEAGIRASLSDELTIGVHVFNPTRVKIAAYNDERMPAIMRLGMDYKFSEKVFVVLEAEKDIDQKPVIKAGIEYQFIDILYLRGGVASNPFLSSFGFGVNLNKLKIDFATSYHSLLGYSPQLSLSYDFN